MPTDKDALWSHGLELHTLLFTTDEERMQHRHGERLAPATPPSTVVFSSTRTSTTDQQLQREVRGKIWWSDAVDYMAAPKP